MKRKLRRTLALFISVAMLFSGNLLTAFAAGETTATVTVDVTYGQTEARTMLKMINDFRTGDEAWAWNENSEKETYSNLGTLAYDYELEAIAMQRAAEIALSYSHTRPDGSSCWTAYTGGYYTAAENIAVGYGTAEAVFEGWQETNKNYSGQGHRRNMLSSSVTAVGIGHVVYNGVDYWVQEFRNPASGKAETSANDSPTPVDVKISLGNTTVTLSYDNDEVKLSCGETATLPTILANIQMTDAWLAKSSSVSADYTWKVENEEYASVSGGEIKALEAGQTSLKTTVLGKDVTIPVTVSHKAGEAVKKNETEATCTTEGSYDSVVYCSGCKAELSRETVKVAALDHSWDEGKVTQQATCTEEGTMTYSCTRQGCDATKTESIPALGHDYQYVDNKDGKTHTGTCTRDGVSITEPHTYVDSVCSECGAVDQSTCEHVWNEGTIEKAATCTEDGSVIYTCTKCGLQKTEKISATGHKAGEAVKENEKAATCTEDGSYDSVVYCSVCKEELSRETVIVKELGHSWDEGEVTKEATCTEDGSVTYTCTVCGDTKVEKLPAAGHKAGEAVKENEKAATCTEEGSYESVVYCSVCKAELSREEVTVAALGHSWDEGKVTKEATCTEDGSVTYTCTVCGDTKVEKLPAAGHKAGEAVKENEKAATCTEEGSYESVVYCSVCKAELSREEVTVAALGHSWDEGKVTKEATCTEDGSVTYTCTVCGDTKVEKLPATGHKAGEAVKENETEATCTEDGSYDSVVYCSVCGKELSREEITVDALGHSWDEGKVIKEATGTEAGSIMYTCTVCGETRTEEIPATGTVTPTDPTDPSETVDPADTTNPTDTTAATVGTETANSNQSTDDNAQTGDEFNMGILFAVMALAGIAAAGTVVIRRRNN